MEYNRLDHYKLNLQSSSSVLSLTESKNYKGCIVGGLVNSFLNFWEPIEYTQDSYFENFPTAEISSVLASDSILICGTSNGSINIWDTNELFNIFTFTGHASRVGCLVMLKNGYLASGDDDAMIIIWDLVNYNSVLSFKAHTMGVSGLCVLNNGDLVIVHPRTVALKYGIKIVLC